MPTGSTNPTSPTRYQDDCVPEASHADFWPRSCTVARVFACTEFLGKQEKKSTVTDAPSVVLGHKRAENLALDLSRGERADQFV